MAIKLLRVLLVQSTRQGHDIVTSDESWIYLFSEHVLMWTAPGEIVVDRERHTVQSPKFMLTVVWNSIGFHIPCSESPPEGAQIQCTTLYKYYTNDILVAISDWRRQTGGTWSNKLWVHSDNARPHTAKMSRDHIGLNRIKQAPHPPYSPDLASSDFFLFGLVKEKLMGYRPETPSEFLVCIRVILAEIPREILNAVFLEWIERLQKCVQVDCGYVGCAKRTQYIKNDSNREIHLCYT
jgi:histone-lysine N-methyltransferase SETMAR